MARTGEQACEHDTAAQRNNGWVTPSRSPKPLLRQKLPQPHVHWVSQTTPDASKGYLGSPFETSVVKSLCVTGCWPNRLRHRKARGPSQECVVAIGTAKNADSRSTVTLNATKVALTLQ